MLLIRGAELAGRAPLDVRLADGCIAAIERELSPLAGEPVLVAGGGALLPGLHDHHLHLLALAAAQESLRCGPPDVRDSRALERALARAPGTDGWIRGIGYHESVAGELDRTRLDGLVPERPARIQHRSGALWIVNSAAVARLGLDTGRDHPGVERDPEGRATGRLLRADGWLREQLGRREPPSLAAVGQRLASYGVTGVTDATATNSSAELCLFARAIERGELLQHLVLMGSMELPAAAGGSLERGALKLVLADPDLPPLDELEQRIGEAHARERPVAVHCVTRVQLLLALAAFSGAGAAPGDRIEHAAVAPPELLAELAHLPLTVVTQPGFLRERGDQYRRDVEARDLAWLYRGRGFLEAGVPLGGSTDAPFGDPDPWRAMQAAVDRSTELGYVMSADERLEPERALGLFTSPAQAPGAPARRVAVGEPADLCLLDRPWSRARSPLSSANVRATFRSGAIVWQRD